MKVKMAEVSNAPIIHEGVYEIQRRSTDIECIRRKPSYTYIFQKQVKPEETSK